MKRISLVIITLLSMFVFSSFTTFNDNISKIELKKENKTNGEDEGEGKVTWYGARLHGRLMANGERFDQNGLTCATSFDPMTGEKEFPFGTKIKITNLRNNKSVVVTVTDTGGFAKHGIKFDLSKAAFEKIGSLRDGVLQIKYEVIS